MRIMTFLIYCLMFSGLYANELKFVSVDSTAFTFSPGNWTGDNGRGGKDYRQTWNAGAYFHFQWSTKSKNIKLKINFDTSMFPSGLRKPMLSYCIDGVWVIDVSVTDEIYIESKSHSNDHKLSVYFQKSEQKERWGSKGQSAKNVMRIKGIEVESEAELIESKPKSKWAMIIGDSITEGIGTSALSSYSHLIGQALNEKGYDYCISACGWSGWLNKGDNPPGDVPGYYVIENGVYHDELSRWNKIDGNNHSLLDGKGHLSAYGHENQEPSLILINYGTNDILHKSNPEDTKLSIQQCLGALRKSAPDAKIVLIVPFGQYYAKQLHEAVEAQDKNVSIIDLGRGVAKAIAVKKGPLGGLHPNDRGHANIAINIH